MARAELRLVERPSGLPEWRGIVQVRCPHLAEPIAVGMQPPHAVGRLVDWRWILTSYAIELLEQACGGACGEMLWMRYGPTQTQPGCHDKLSGWPLGEVFSRN